MNAYELADALAVESSQMEYGYVVDDWELLCNSSKMLRQQADRIAELEKQGEPVAWMQMHHKDNIPTKFSPVKVWEDDIPLYTAPQIKPLSDEEIEQIAVKWYVGTRILPIGFARAILKKASEK